MFKGKEAPKSRIRDLAGVAGLILVTLAVILPASAQAAEKGVVPDLTWATSSADQDKTAAALSDVGAKWVRLTANWADAEPSKGQYNSWWLAQYDRAVQLARNAGARIVIVSYQSPSWASGSSNKETPPRDPADYARFMNFLAKRYAGKVEAYEVWNEENIDRFWSTGASPGAYVSLLKPAYSAIKSGDPNAKVVFGGVSMSDYRFIEGAYAAGAKGYFDVMSVHPYSCYGPEVVRRGADNRITYDSFAGYREVHASMAANGDSKPIWFTEFGWSTTSESCGVSEATQADYLTKALRYVEQDPYVQVALWYNFRNNYWNHDQDTLEGRYGLMRTDFSQKPAYGALKSYVPGVPAPSSTPAVTTPKRKKTRTTLAVTGVSASSAQRSSRSRTRHAKRRMIVGKVVGAPSGHVKVRLQRFNRTKHRWVKVFVRVTKVTSGGRFKQKLRHGIRRGRWRAKGIYEGAPGYDASSSRLLYFKV